MHIVIATVGTRGDAQPYVALGKALQARGHQVTVATHEDHRELAETNNLGFRPVCGRFRELMASSPGRRWLESGASPRRYLKAFREMFEPLAAGWIAEFDSAVADADAVLVHSVASPAITAIHGRKLPYAVLSPFGSVPSGEFSIGLPDVPFVTARVNRFAFALALDAIWKVGDGDAGRHLAKRGVSKPRAPMWRDQLRRSVAHLNLFSEHVVARPKDWPACAEVTGYCFLDAPATWQPPARLVEFLAATPQPIYVGFGSMTGMQPEQLARLTRDALRGSRQRAVIGMGWGGIKDFEASDDVLLVDDVPHEWLFPRVAAVVHHCGAGTTAAALRAGRPSVAVPFFGDQPFWGRTLHALGTAPAPIPKGKLTAPRLASAISQATSDPRYAARAATIGAAIRSEDGAGRAADRALHHFATS